MNTRWLAYACVLMMPLGYACKGGDPSFIMVLGTEPDDDREDVQIDTRVGFRINANIDPNTLTEQNFFVTDPQGTRVQGALAVDPNEPDVAVLTPVPPLSVITTYTATVTTGLASTGGATLENDYQWRFTTLDSAWGNDDWLEAVGTGNSAQPQIAVDGQSNALAVWEYTETTGTRIWASRYTRVDLWFDPATAPEPIDDGTEPSSNPKLAIDDAGNGFAIWQQTPAAAISNIWTSRYVVDEGWGTPLLLQSEVTRARSPSIATDPAGNATAVWFQRELDSTNRVVWASRYDHASGVWSTAEPIDPMPTSSPGERTWVGMDDQGNAIAVWARRTFPAPGRQGEMLWANRYIAGVGWGRETAVLIKPDPETSARDERLSVGPNGDAFVVWVQNDPTRGDIDDIWGVRFAGSWGDPGRIDDYDAGEKREPDIAVDGMGIAYAVWSQADQKLTPDFYNIYASEYTPTSGRWGTPELIEPANEEPSEDEDATSPRVGVNAAGNVFVVWRQNWQDWGSIWSNRLDPGDAQWMPMRTELIENSERAAGVPKIAVDNNRHAHAVWLHNLAEGTWVRTNRFE